MRNKNHYCEQCKKRHHGDSHFMPGFMMGAMIGAALGVLFAPGPGENTRKKLKEVSGEAFEKAEDLAEDVKLAAAPLLEEVEKNMGPVLKRARKSGKGVQDQVLEKIEQLVDEAEDVADDVGKGAKKMFKNVKK